MIRSFLTITLRILWRNKVTSLVDISSLSIGITSFIFIMLYVYHETSYDKFNENYEPIYRLEGDDYGKLPPVIGTYVKDRIPEVENVARLAAGFKGNLTYTPEVNPEDLKHVEVDYFWADSTVFDVFTLPFVQGEPKTALTEPYAVVISETTAKKLFGNTDPMGKALDFNSSRFLITGVMQDVRKSHIEVDALFSFVWCFCEPYFDTSFL